MCCCFWGWSSLRSLSTAPESFRATGGDSESLARFLRFSREAKLKEIRLLPDSPSSVVPPLRRRIPDRGADVQKVPSVHPLVAEVVPGGGVDEDGRGGGGPVRGGGQGQLLRPGEICDARGLVVRDVLVVVAGRDLAELSGRSSEFALELDERRAKVIRYESVTDCPALLADTLTR
uniref:PDZ domain-containing protein n=1 Tax=Steinernema glaseri TaxID=37863 RepID=A0A1I7YCT1_9BILA